MARVICILQFTMAEEIKIICLVNMNYKFIYN